MKIIISRFRQIQSDMMKKVSMKKNQQKKFQANLRSSSSFGVFGPQQQNFFQGQSQLAVSPSGQLSTKSQIQKAQIMSKFQRDGQQQLGQLHQSANLNGANRLPTEENGQELENQNIAGKKHKLKTQRSCEFVIYNQNQSPMQVRSIDDNDIMFLNQGFPSPNNKMNKNHNLKQSTQLDQNGPNSYLKQSKMNQTTDFVGQKPQRQFQSPLNKRSQQKQQLKTNTNNNQLGNNKQEMSPSGRSSTAISKQGFYSPQVNPNKSNNGAQSVTNRRHQIESDQKRFLERKKVDTSAIGGQKNSKIYNQNGSYTTTATAASEKNYLVNSVQFSNPNNTSHSNKQLVQSQIVKQSNGFQAQNTSMNNGNGKFQNQSKTNGTHNNGNNSKKKDSNVININNRQSELDELDLRIQLIEREIERDNELADKHYASSIYQTKRHSVQINTKNNSKSKIKKIQATTPSHQLSTDQGIFNFQQPNSNSNRHSTHEKASTTTHKQSIGSPNFNAYSPKYGYLSSETAQLRKSQIHNDDRNDFQKHEKNTYIQSKTQQEFYKAKLIQSDHHGYSQESSSYTNTPRQIDPIHDFRPVIKQYKKQVNFKGNGTNPQDTQEKHIDKFVSVSPGYFHTSSHQYTPASPLNLSVPSGVITPKQFNLYQLNNIQNQKHTNTNRTSKNNQGSNQSLKFQKKHVVGNQNSQNSNSNFQNSIEGVDGDDNEISEFEYLEKIINAKKSESSQNSYDQSSQNGSSYEAQYSKNKTDPKQKKSQSTLIQQQQFKEIGKNAASFKKQGDTRQTNSNREIVIPQNQQINSTDSSPFQIIKSNKTNGNSYLSLKQSEINPSSEKPVSYSDNSQKNSFQQTSSTPRQQNPIKVQLKTLENNFIINTDQESKYNNYFNNRSSELINKDNNNNSNLSNLNNITNNMNRNATHTPSASSNSISTVSQGMTPQTQGSQSTSSLNKGNQVQVKNKQNNNLNIQATHTQDKNKNDHKTKNSEQTYKVIIQDQKHSSSNKNEVSKKSNLKQAHFQDEKEDHNIEQMSKHLHQKLNLLLETANQCNQNMKSYRVNNNN